MKKLVVILTASILGACATGPHKCDCAKEVQAAKAASCGSSSTTPTSAVAVVPPAPKIEEEKTVSSADIESINKMIKAVDDYVFREKKEDFTNLCKDPRFDCWLNEKTFPKGKKKVRRKISPFVSGSKTGLQGAERVTVRYSFYP